MIDLSAFIRPDETALQLYARNYVEPVQTGTFFCQTVIPGQIIEICGRSGSGKTIFLLQAALTAILPHHIENHDIGGLEENALFIDLDQKFDILRLMEMLHARVQPALSSLGRFLPWAEGFSCRGDEELDAVINTCLQRFHLISCSNSFEMLAAFKTLYPFIVHLQGAQGIHLLLIDNIAAYHWLDYPVKAQPRVQGQASSDLTLQAVHTAAASILKGLAKQLKLAVLVSKHCFKSLTYSEHDEADYWQLKEMMCKPWQEAVSQRIIVRRVDEDPSSGREGFLAKWDKPLGSQIFRYSIIEAGIAA